MALLYRSRKMRLGRPRRLPMALSSRSRSSPSSTGQPVSPRRSRLSLSGSASFSAGERYMTVCPGSPPKGASVKLIPSPRRADVGVASRLPRWLPPRLPPPQPPSPPPPPLACIPAHRPPAALEKVDCAMSSATIGMAARSEEPALPAGMRAPCAADAGRGATAGVRW
eukprot:scaffold28633_cov61-Phaeocystis_antarctica.AAC.5